MWSPASMRIVSASECSRRLRFRRTASAVPRYHSATRPRAMYRGRSLTPPLVRSRSHGRPRPMWSLSERGLYCVRTTTSLISELTQLDSVKSMIRYLPPNGTAGLARTDERIESRSPSPPARTIANVRFTGSSSAYLGTGSPRSMLAPLRGPLEEQPRVREAVLEFHHPVQVGARRPAGQPFVGNDLTGIHVIAGLDDRLVRAVVHVGVPRQKLR